MNDFQTCCAHCRVDYKRIDHIDGTCSDSWICADGCGTKFLPVLKSNNGIFTYFARPTIVCLCGSTRFMYEFQKANLDETLKGNIVLSIGCNTKSDSDLIALGELTEEKKQFLDELHKRKIDLCDEVLILNVGGYIGCSTRSELEYAVRNNKIIRYLET